MPKCHEEPSMMGVVHDTYIDSRGYMIAQGVREKKTTTLHENRAQIADEIPFIFGMAFMPKCHNDSGRA